MKKQIFTLLCCAVAILILAGAVWKYTALAELRVPLIYKYKLTYTVEIADVPEDTADMYYAGMGLYLGAEVPAGNVTKVESAPAQSGAENCEDITLHVSATAASEAQRVSGACELTEDNTVAFLSRFIDFTGKITEVTVVDE